MSSSLEKQIGETERVARGLEDETRFLRILKDHLPPFAESFLSGLEDAPAYDDQEKPSFAESAPNEEPAASEAAVLQDFEKRALPFGMNAASGRFFGYVPGGGVPEAALGDFLAALTNRYAGVYQASPGAVELENTVVRWFCDWIGYPESAWGTLLSGGSLATLTAVVAARERRDPSDWPISPIYLTGECHHAIAKSLHVAGLSHVPLRYVPVDDNYRMEAGALATMVQEDRARGYKPWIVFASAGTINTGVVDPLAEIADVATSEHLWFHVDAAYGGFFLLTQSARSLFAGLERADSVVLDPHKGLFMPYGLGAVLVRDTKPLREAMSYSSDYLADVWDPHTISPADVSPELTRHFRALRLWISVKLHGLGRFRAALEEKLLLARYAFERLSSMDSIGVGPRPELSCVTFRAVHPDPQTADARTSQLLSKILADGRVHFSSTKLDGRIYLRMCILCFRSHKAQVDTALAEIQRHVDLLS